MSNNNNSLTAIKVTIITIIALPLLNMIIFSDKRGLATLGLISLLANVVIIRRQISDIIATAEYAVYQMKNSTGSEIIRQDVTTTILPISGYFSLVLMYWKIVYIVTYSNNLIKILTFYFCSTGLYFAIKWMFEIIDRTTVKRLRTIREKELSYDYYRDDVPIQFSGGTSQNDLIELSFMDDELYQ